MTFNRLHGERRHMTVGKSYVYEVIKRHQYDIQVVSQKIKHRKPKALRKNLIWSMDLTQVRDSTNQSHSLFGIIDNGSRECLRLRNIPDKASITLLRIILDTITLYDKPKIIRTDNEAVFTSRLFRFGLWFLGIKHQRTEKCCPWMNGRIERLFGALKDKPQHYMIESADTLTRDISHFRCWYSHVRPRHHLDNRTPAEIWSGKPPNNRGKHRNFYSWSGALTDFYLPPG